MEVERNTKNAVGEIRKGDYAEMLEGIEQLSKKDLQDIILKMQKLLSDKQKKEFRKIVEMHRNQPENKKSQASQVRMSDDLVNEKMAQIQKWKDQIDEGELCLDTEEYEDYSRGYWESDWITEYYDNQGIGDKIQYMIRFAEDCVDDRRYQEANEIYEWLWEMEVSTESEYDEGDPVDLETLEENNLIHTDMKRLALLTLYADYQALPANERARDIYLYFSYGTFTKLHLEEMFHVGREELEDTEQFWKDWIDLLQKKNGDTEARLLKEAILYCKGIDGLCEMAEENASVHPSLYLSVMEQYERGHLYNEIEKVGENALSKIDVSLTIRSEIALKTAFAASCLNHEEKMMQFCWESFVSDSTVKNYLRLFGTEKMANTYGIRGREVLDKRLKGNQEFRYRNSELNRNIMGDYEYYRLLFYTGYFDAVKNISKNPEGSLGWSSSFIDDGIRLFLLYLYDRRLPSKAAKNIVSYIEFSDEKNPKNLLKFEKEIQNECQEHKVSEFWNYFQRWKKYFPMEEKKRRKYLAWAENIIYKRADAIVSGQHRSHYGEVAVLLAIVGEIKEDMGMQGAGRDIYEQYKKKFPRHSSFQGQMKDYFNITK